ncbi:MAG: MgtC/SapB family protein, partial [Bacteroidaceae bacterium]|nr:MgtC/SapB family protein [Bacteroidaceae bacterium]
MPCHGESLTLPCFYSPTKLFRTMDLTDTLQQIADTTDVTVGTALLKMLLSMVLGATVGLERRHKGQIAGMRTFALI